MVTQRTTSEAIEYTLTRGVVQIEKEAVLRRMRDAAANQRANAGITERRGMKRRERPEVRDHEGLEVRVGGVLEAAKLRGADDHDRL